MNSSKWKGIYNPDTICYLSSVLQQLFMIPDIRNTILQGSSVDHSTLRQLFFRLNDISDQSSTAITIESFLEDFGKEIHYSINIHEQRDASDFLRRVLSILISSKDMVVKENTKNLFGGTLIHDIFVENQREQYLLSRNETYSFLSIPVKHHSRLIDALSSFIKPINIKFSWSKIVDEENDENSSKQIILPSIKQTRIISFPKHLILLLKRFDYDRDVLEIKKQNGRFEYPIELNLSFLVDSDSIHSNNCNYKLGGVIIHNGNARSGHYYSVIRDREYDISKSISEWYLFDDEEVIPFDVITDLENESFGYSDDIENGRNAFILVYDKISL